MVPHWVWKQVRTIVKNIPYSVPEHHFRSPGPRRWIAALDDELAIQPVPVKFWWCRTGTESERFRLVLVWTAKYITRKQVQTIVRKSIWASLFGHLFNVRVGVRIRNLKIFVWDAAPRWDLHESLGGSFLEETTSFRDLSRKSKWSESAEVEGFQNHGINWCPDMKRWRQGCDKDIMKK